MPAAVAVPIAEAALPALGIVTSGYLQSRGANKASQVSDLSNRAQLAYLQQKDYDAALAAADAQRNNYNQWRAGQQTTNDMLQARERRMGALGSLIGAPQRMPITTYIPDYVEPTLPSTPTPNNTLRSYLSGR